MKSNRWDSKRACSSVRGLVDATSLAMTGRRAYSFIGVTHYSYGEGFQKPIEKIGICTLGLAQAPSSTPLMDMIGYVGGSILTARH